MKLDESGDVSWVIPPGAEDLPLFSCDTYDVFNTSLAGSIIFLRFGAYNGHIIEFKVRWVSYTIIFVLMANDVILIDLLHKNITTWRVFFFLFLIT